MCEGKAIAPIVRQQYVTGCINKATVLRREMKILINWLRHLGCEMAEEIWVYAFAEGTSVILQFYSTDVILVLFAVQSP